MTVRRLIPIAWMMAAGCAIALPQPAIPPQSAVLPQSLTAGEAQARVDRALANELAAAQDPSHPMRYRLRKSTPRLSTTREIYETQEGGVARLIVENDQPLSPAAEENERERLQELAADPGRQRHRMQAEAADRARALSVLRALPAAFLYRYAGPGQGPAGPVERYRFVPNPAYSPPSLATDALAGMSGEIWVDPQAMRVVRLRGTLDRDVSFGWGILGRLNRGGWILIEQAPVDGGEWRTVRLQLAMSGRVLFKARRFDMVETMSGFVPLPVGMSYREAIARLLAEQR
jgi:hypothetical protein